MPGIGIDAGGIPVPNPVNDTNVHVLRDYPLQASDEGRAMMQIIHDVAPQANLAFRTGFINTLDFAQGILDLKDADCDIIVDDITYISEPFFEDGVVAQAVDYVVSQGVTYFSAAGNFGSQSYESNFNPEPAPTGLTGFAHAFDIGDIYQSINVDEGNYTLVLQWDDGTDFGTTNTDLDIYLANDDGTTLFGFNRDNTGGNPIEVLPFTVGEGGDSTNILIVNASGPTTVALKYVVFRGIIQFNEYNGSGASTIVGHVNAEGAIAVGAVLYSNTPAYGVNPPTIASFSSRGGTTVDGIVRVKPDIAAPNGINTTVDFGSLNIDGDPFPNFFGTSAAAPHAAAVAALLEEATSKFYNTDLSPGATREILQNSALDMDGSGYDVASGYGLIQADAALLGMANPSPVISGLIYDTTLIPGTDTIVLTVVGNYLTDGSLIYFNGYPVGSGSTLLTDTSLSAIILPFTDLFAMVQVYNPPDSATNGSDGGLSDPIYFDEKEKILISIDDKSKLYGEVLPGFTASYSIESVDNSVPLDSAGLTTAEMERILNIPFETVAGPLSNTGLWEIVASSSDPLNPESGITAIDSIDIAILDQFDFVFESGLLEIENSF